MTLEVAEGTGCHSGVLHESRLLQELPYGPVLLEDAMRVVI